jgi:opacity protein-like surface antigen
MINNKVFRKACYFVLFLLSFSFVDAKASNDIIGTVGLELGVIPFLDKEIKDFPSNKYGFNFLLNGGTRNDYFGIELFYQTTTPNDKKIKIGEVFLLKSKSSLSSFGIDFLGYYQINNQGTEVLVGVGIANYTFKCTFKYTFKVKIADYTYKESETSVRFILGVQHALSQNIKLGANFKYSPVNVKFEGEKAVKGVTEFNFSTKYEF